MPSMQEALGSSPGTTKIFNTSMEINIYLWSSKLYVHTVMTQHSNTLRKYKSKWTRTHPYLPPHFPLTQDPENPRFSDFTVFWKAKIWTGIHINA